VATVATPAAATGPAVPIAGLAVEIASRAANGERSFQIRLDPPDLGRIDVQLSVDTSGRVTSHVTAERPDTLALLRQDAPSLQRALESAGLRTSTGGLEFSLRNQSFAGGGQSQHSPATPFARIVLPDSEPAPVESASRGYARPFGARTGVDIRV
jgi:chemotaxis protein MotD